LSAAHSKRDLLGRLVEDIPDHHQEPSSNEHHKE
jgi:hypothetical protein